MEHYFPGLADHAQTPGRLLGGELGAAAIDGADAAALDFAQAILDGVALRMNREANSSVLVVGYTAVAEKGTLGLMRANNAKAYLTKDKGIDASRVVTKDGGKGRAISAGQAGHSSSLWDLSRHRAKRWRLCRRTQKAKDRFL